MTLPRWLVIGMVVSMMLVVTASLWWWVTSPLQTADEFITMAREGRLEETAELMGEATWRVRDRSSRADDMISLDDGHGGFRYEAGHYIERSREEWRTQFRDEVLVIQPRTISDVFTGRRRFRIWDGNLEFVANTGTVTCVQIGTPSGILY